MRGTCSWARAITQVNLNGLDLFFRLFRGKRKKTRVGAPSARPTRARSGQTRLPSDVTYRVSRYNVISERDDGTMTVPPPASSTAAQAENNLPAYMLGTQATDAAASAGSRIVGRIRYRSDIDL